MCVYIKLLLIMISDNIMNNQDIMWNFDVMDNQDVMNNQDDMWDFDVMDNQDIIYNSDVMNTQDDMWDFDVIDNQDIIYNSDVMNNQDDMWDFDVMDNQDTMWDFDIIDNQDIICNLMNNQDNMSDFDIMDNRDIRQLTWDNKLAKLKAFIDLNKRRPKLKSKTEKVLVSWLSTQLRNRKKEKYNMLNEDIRNSWDRFIKDYKQYFLSNEELWTNNLTELKSFIDLNKRRPLDKKETEKVMASWLNTQIKNRKVKKNSMFNENIRGSWDNFIKDYSQYFLSNEELWTNKLTELKIFIDLNKCKPSQIKETEKVLGSWLSNQLRNRKTEKQIMSNKDIRTSWDNFIKYNEQHFISNKEL